MVKVWLLQPFERTPNATCDLGRQREELFFVRATKGPISFPALHKHTRSHFHICLRVQIGLFLRLRIHIHMPIRMNVGIIYYTHTSTYFHRSF